VKAVWKYPLNLRGVNKLSMPKGARVVKVEQQPGSGPCVWVIVDPSVSPEQRWFEVVGTGHPFGDNRVYVGSWQDPPLPFMWHLLEVTP
jgi:hypothetical protein